jgi:hypothetical protein
MILGYPYFRKPPYRIIVGKMMNNYGRIIVNDGTIWDYPDEKSPSNWPMNLVNPIRSIPKFELDEIGSTVYPLEMR